MAIIAKRTIAVENRDLTATLIGRVGREVNYSRSDGAIVAVSYVPEWTTWVAHVIDPVTGAFIGDGEYAARWALDWAILDCTAWPDLS